MKRYTKPSIDVYVINAEDIMTVSAVRLKNGGENGQPLSESFGTLFGE